MKSSLATSLAGGVLIGGGASLLLLTNGRVAGVSGIIVGALRPRPGEWTWRAAFLLGLLAGGGLLAVLLPAAIAPARGSSALLLVAGAIVGFGSRLAGGCTSGHGICGLGRLSPRSLIATLTFMVTGVATVGMGRLLGGL